MTFEAGSLPAPAREEADPYWIDRFIRALVTAGYGDYEAAASADIVEAAVFLFLNNDVKTHVRSLLLGLN